MDKSKSKKGASLLKDYFENVNFQKKNRKKEKKRVHRRQKHELLPSLQRAISHPMVNDLLF